MLTKKVSRLIAPDCGASAMLRNAAFMLALAAAQPVFAADPYNSDHPGGSDHPLLSRYQGSMLYMYGEDSLGTTQIVVDEKRKAVLRPLEGKIASRLYWGPKGRSPLEVFRNYRHALESAGFQTVYACETPKCETDRVQSMIYELPRTAAWKKGDPMIDSTFNSANQPAFHYISARRDGPSGATHVMVALVGGSNDAPVLGRVRQFITIVEPAKAELGKVTVDAKAIQSSLQRDGRIALYGVTFETNKAELQKESDVQLAEMASVLKASPLMKVFIVGHTDNQGELQANVSLSQRRAESVVAALGSRYGVSPTRMVGRGVANFAPVASNDTERGRAQNRRVEMVLR